jgi:hypothetical protein
MNSLMETEDLQTIDQTKDWLSELVGENKKFRSVNDLAKGKAEADRYVEMIIKQKDELASDYLKLKADYDARAKLEELLDQRTRQSQEEYTPSSNQPPKEVDFDSLIEKKISERERLRQREENVKQTKQMLKEKLGSNYSSKLQEKLNELDLTEEEAFAMAQRSPKAFVRTLGLDSQPSSNNMFQTPPTSQVRASEFRPKTEQRTWSWYQDLKAKNPRAWLDPKIQTQMYHDAQALGSAFGDGDFVKHDNKADWPERI